MLKVDVRPNVEPHFIAIAIRDSLIKVLPTQQKVRGIMVPFTEDFLPHIVWAILLKARPNCGIIRKAAIKWQNKWKKGEDITKMGISVIIHDLKEEADKVTPSGNKKNNDGGELFKATGADKPANPHAGKDKNKCWTCNTEECLKARQAWKTHPKNRWGRMGKCQLERCRCKKKHPGKCPENASINTAEGTEDQNTDDLKEAQPPDNAKVEKRDVTPYSKEFADQQEFA